MVGYFPASVVQEFSSLCEVGLFTQLTALSFIHSCHLNGCQHYRIDKHLEMKTKGCLERPLFIEKDCLSCFELVRQLTKLST